MAKGSCMCGQVEYEYTGDPAVTALCRRRDWVLFSLFSTPDCSTNIADVCDNCIDCQKWTGGPYTSNAVVPRTNFKVTKGQPKDYDATGASGKINKHWFCPNCGSSLYTELEVMPDVTCVKAGSLDGGEASLGNKIGVEFYTKDRVQYLNAVDGAKQETHFG